MADRNLGYDIDVDYDGAQAAQRALDDLQKFERGIDDVERAADKVSTTTGGMFEKARSSWTEFNSALDVVTQGFGYVQQAAQVAWDTVNRGADLQRTEEQAIALAESIGTSWELLQARMTDATGGMISQAELTASAVDIMSLGLADTADETIRLATLIGELGWDMQTLTLTLANDSTARLDSLGLSMEGVTERADELKEAGLSASEAFDLAVIEAGEEKLKLLGSAAGTTAGDIKVLEATWQDFLDTIAQNSADAAAPLLGIATAEIAINQAIDDGILKQGTLERAQARAFFTGAEYRDILAELVTEIERVRQAELDTQIYYELINNQRLEAIRERKNATEELAAVERDATFALQDARDIDPGGGQYAENLRAARQEIYAFKDGLYENREALIAQADAADEFAERIEAAAQTAADAWAAYVIEAQSASGQAFTAAAFGFDEETVYNQEQAIYDWAEAAGFGAGALGDLAREYGLLTEEQIEFGTKVAQDEAIFRNLSTAIDASRESILQYKVAVESAQNQVNQRQSPVDQFDASTFFDQGGDELVGVDASPIVTSIRNAVGEARGIVEGFANPDDVYEAFVELNYDDVQSGVTEAQSLIDGIEGKTVFIDVVVSGIEEAQEAIDEVE